MGGGGEWTPRRLGAGRGPASEWPRFITCIRNHKQRQSPCEAGRIFSAPESVLLRQVLLGRQAVMTDESLVCLSWVRDTQPPHTPHTLFSKFNEVIVSSDENVG